jgi:predicted nucleic acid-binding Zn ribbon protein
MPGLLQESLQSLGLAERLRDAEIWRVWNETVGTVVAIRAQPLRIINGTLTVAVSSAPWIQELRFMTGIMKEKLNNRLGAEVVREIVLKAGRVDTPLTVEPQDILHKKRLTPRQKALIEEHSSSITDPETREAFAELMKASFESQT